MRQSPSGGCVLKPARSCRIGGARGPVAFRRLCVETLGNAAACGRCGQSPSGGCVLKQSDPYTNPQTGLQSPSGGCVLKPDTADTAYLERHPVAFRRLCVETWASSASREFSAPVAFRRLCVETNCRLGQSPARLPVAFRRLCVETLFKGCFYMANGNPVAFRRLCVETISGLKSSSVIAPVAFRRLCVETRLGQTPPIWCRSSRLRAAVC